MSRIALVMAGPWGSWRVLSSSLVLEKNLLVGSRLGRQKTSFPDFCTRPTLAATKAAHWESDTPNGG